MPIGGWRRSSDRRWGDWSHEFVAAEVGSLEGLASADRIELIPPVRQVCPHCGHDDPENLTWEVEGPGLWRYRCVDPSHGDPYDWLTTGKDALSGVGAGGDGLADQLGIYDDLLACFTPDGPLLEYGVVEYLYATENPAAYRDLVNRYSHTRRGPTKFSASAFIGAALGRLYREGLLRRVDFKATGSWRFNGRLTAQSLAGSNKDAVETWEQFAIGRGLDPNDWPVTLLG